MLAGHQMLQFLREALKSDNMQKLPNGMRGVPIEPLDQRFFFLEA